ncbi:MAG TPA: glucose-6-phosphate isomerase [Desulfovibrio sp.]|uniref:glucose-6-phosphate isomerase n=1 Tax=Desulfovibrio sp. TaxID=885 RepID=UPI002A43BB91|nr:glucose-6-phosphate isomerase [Desulfovibrio sp.]MDY0305212.1 glucose-6-phosphate isomerase [Desulfovibrionaceae bacterium]HMM38674.1 glucose-6-phosphate isomerase [Desulfovibrio sp.]
MSDALDWTNAWEAKLPLGPHTGRAGELAARLAGEVKAGKLPFVNMPYRESLKGELAAAKAELGRFEHMLLLGIGGSALGARFLQRAFAPGQDQPGHAGPWLWIADNVDAISLEAWLAKLPPEKTLVLAVSKSGGTIETTGQYFIVTRWLEERLGAAWKRHLWFVTDAKSGFFRQEADRLGCRSLPVPENLGGRYSVLSAVGLVPAEFLGIDSAELVAGAKEVLDPLAAPGLDGAALAAHPSFRLAAWAAGLMDAGFCEMIFFGYVPLWASLGDWFAQLWAESLGKQGKGSQPIPAVGVTDQHSVNQMFLDGPRNKACLFLTCEGLPPGPRFPASLPEKFGYVADKTFGELLSAEAFGTRMALTRSGVPLVEIALERDTPRAAGKVMGLLGAATILTGRLLDIDPLDQPAVELGKRLAQARMGCPGLDREKADLDACMLQLRDAQEF